MSVKLIIVLLIIAAFFFLLFRKIWTMKNTTITHSDAVLLLNDQSFAHQTKSGVVLVDFWAEWCMPCRIIGPIVNEIADELQGKVTVAKLNVDENQVTAARFRVQSIPTLIIFKNGKEVERITGVRPKNQLLASLQRYY